MSESSPLLSVAQALERLLKDIQPVEIEETSLRDVHGRMLAAEVVAPFDYPRFPNSSMDGFAVTSMDIVNASKERPVTLTVIEDIPAGVMPQKTINPGECARIMTGAVVPKGADAVVPLEETDLDGHQSVGGQIPDNVKIYMPAVPGDYMRRVGDDIRAGTRVMQPQRLRPQDVGFLAMLGLGNVKVYRRPRVALFSTGDELLSVEKALIPGSIYDTNSHTLAGMVEKYGGEAISLGIVRDTYAAVHATLELAVENRADMILSSAGVSVGAFDYVRTVVQEHGTLTFWRVNMRPGKPLTFGNYRGIPFIGLPGNPVSSFVGFEVFVRPAIRKMSGDILLKRASGSARLEEPVESDGRESYLRAIIRGKSGDRSARLTGHQGSGNLFSLVQANALLIIPTGVKSLPSGARVEYWPLDEDFGGNFVEEDDT